MKKQTKAFIGNTYFIYTLGLLFVFGLWFLFAFIVGGENLIFPSPIETIKAAGDILSRSYIYKGIGWTILRTLMGFVAAFILAFILGSLAGHYKKLYLFLKPLMLVAKSIPTAALVFLFLILSGS